MTQQEAWKFLALFFAVLAAITGFLFLRMHWAPGVDFDLTGFFWLIRNTPRLSVFVLFIICAGSAITLWIRAQLSGR